MAFSNLSIMLTPVLFGFLSSVLSINIFPAFLAIMFTFMAGCTVALKIGDIRSKKRWKQIFIQAHRSLLATWEKTKEYGNFSIAHTSCWPTATRTYKHYYNIMGRVLLHGNTSFDYNLHSVYWPRNPWFPFWAAWPAIYTEFKLPFSYASFVTMLIPCGTIISSMLSARLIVRFGTSRITTFSTFLTVISLLGFPCSDNFLCLCIFSISLGLGAGALDTALNNYVALHYSAAHMSFLHCFYGIGVSLSPYSHQQSRRVARRLSNCLWCLIGDCAAALLHTSFLVKSTRTGSGKWRTDSKSADAERNHADSRCEEYVVYVYHLLRDWIYLRKLGKYLSSESPPYDDGPLCGDCGILLCWHGPGTSAFWIVSFTPP